MLIHEFFGEGHYAHRLCKVYMTKSIGYMVIFLGEGRGTHAIFQTEKEAEMAAEDWVLGAS